MATASRQAFIGAGSNLGDRAATLRGAIGRLRLSPGIERVEAAALFETEPVGVVDQPMFLNTVIGVETTLTPEALLERLLEIEREFGRVRSGRWGPRTLDLDLLVFEAETRASAFLQLPHPRLFERSFVLTPLGELLGSPRYARKCWEDLRARVAAIPLDPGVRRTG